MATKKKIKFDPDKDRVLTFSRDGEKLSEVNGELKSDFYSGIEKMCYLSDEYCAFYKGKKMGILDNKGVMITPAEWLSISYKEGVFKISKKNKVTKCEEYGYINLEGELLFNPEEYTSVCDVFDGRIVVESLDAGKEGAFDLEGNMVVSPKYLRLGLFYQNVAVACEEQGKVGLIDLLGNWVLQPEYSSISGFSRNREYCIVAKDGKYGILSKDLNIVVEPKYDGIFDLDATDGLILVVKSEGKQGVVDASGNWLVPAEYDRISLYGEDHYIEMEKNNKFSLSDMRGRMLETDSSLSDLSVKDGLIYMNGYNKDYERVTVIKSLDGTVLFEGKEAKIFQNIILVSSDGKKWGVINHKAEEILSQEWNLSGVTFLNQVNFSDGLLNLKKEEKTIYLDERGEIKISVDTCGWAFSDGYAIIGKKDDYSLINKSGEIVAFNLPHVSHLGNGYFFINNVEENDPKILNVNTGEQVEIPARIVGKPNNGLVKIQAPDCKYGVVEVATGKVILEPVYDSVLLTAAGIWGYLPKMK
ncbi:MAG: WG repeat-containing protein [Muribaculaceae bacterium]|nr:WG repeat-containing protein [Muribaculaceae bacterium]